jgi:hypothetical protein
MEAGGPSISPHSSLSDIQSIGSSIGAGANCTGRGAVVSGTGGGTKVASGGIAVSVVGEAR